MIECRLESVASWREVRCVRAANAIKLTRADRQRGHTSRIYAFKWTDRPTGIAINTNYTSARTRTR